MFLQRFLDEDFDLVDELVRNNPPFTAEIAEALSEFFRKHDLLFNYLKWIIQKEVSRHDSIEGAFVSKSFYLTALNVILFSTLGVKYIASNLTPLVSHILETSESFHVKAESILYFHFDTS